MENAIIQEVNGLERILIMRPPYDLKSKGCGIHGMEICFIIRKNNEGVQFLVFTPIHLEHVANDLFKGSKQYNMFKVQGADVGYHALSPRYEGQTPVDECNITGGKCYCDGSGLRAIEWAEIWLKEGNDVIWNMLEEYYREEFGEIK